MVSAASHRGRLGIIACFVASLVLNGCFAGAVGPVWITGVDQAYIVPATALDGKTPTERRAFITEWYTLIALPAEREVMSGELLYIVPRCSGRTEWDAAKFYPVNSNYQIEVTC